MLVELENVIPIIMDAGKAVKEIYEIDFGIYFKEDKSPLTEADRVSNDILKRGLTEHFPGIPIISEEEKEVSYEVRKDWEHFWLIDPLDGTKEFIKKNGEFTINVALIEKDTPILGVVYAPALNLVYYAQRGRGAYKFDLNTKEETKLPSERRECDIIKVVVSRSHLSRETEEFVEMLKSRYGDVEFVSVGSSLKICLVAEGKADIYPRLGPTMEWDTAAAHVVALESGCKLYVYPFEEGYKSLRYNKKDIKNPYFVFIEEKLWEVLYDGTTYKI